MKNAVVGANEDGFHLVGVNFGRDLPEPLLVADIRNAVAGDPSPDGKGKLEICRGIEVGHIFQLRTKYAEAMNCTYLDKEGKTQIMEMGCYGIGVSRIVGAAIEQNFDDKGIIFPQAMAPFEVVIVPIGYHRNELVKAEADKLYAELTAAGIDVALDDRDERPGVMFADMELIRGVFRLQVFSSFSKHVRSFFQHPKLIALMEFPVLFLGAMPQDTPALYSLMNYGGYALGTHYPIGGFYQLVLAMKSVAEKQGAIFHFNSKVEKIHTDNKKVKSLQINGINHEFDAVIASSDYHHTETLLNKEYRNYTDEYWENRTFAPSSLIFYLGIHQTIPNLKHHTLFFENDLDEHIDCIYGDKKWPEKPLFYVCCPSKTDDRVAPKGKENLFLLMPLAIGINDDENVKEKYLIEMLSRIEKHTGITDLASKIEYKKSYCVSDFISDYNAYGGNAYGLANTLDQTAVLKPKIKNKKLNNLFYTGQLTVPGPGVPPSIISGKIIAQEVNKLKKEAL